MASIVIINVSYLIFKIKWSFWKKDLKVKKLFTFILWTVSLYLLLKRIRDWICGFLSLI